MHLRHNVSPLRQKLYLTEYDPKRGVSVATLAYEYPSGYEVAEHAHGSDQLIYAISGLMEVSSGQSMWLIPPHFALWIPARCQHRIHMTGPVAMRTLYMRRGLASGLGAQCAVLHVVPFLRELIVEIVRVGRLRVRNRYELALREVLVAQLAKASSIPSFVIMPREARALAVAQAAMRSLAASKSLAMLCSEAGVGVRTVERMFRSDVGTSFELWRQQVRLTKAVELLASGYSVKQVAFAVGYRQPSAFVEMFRRVYGTTPKLWASKIVTQ
jgi:AraC-like DNA-binding protein/mannose-6-phosphate isomerase-like protein (cupin superfamily)